MPEPKAARPVFEPTFGPDTTKSGGAWKKAGARVLIPNFTEVTLGVQIFIRREGHDKYDLREGIDIIQTSFFKSHYPPYRKYNI